MSSVYSIVYCHLHIMRFICVIFNIECKMNKLIVVESTVDKQTQYNFLFIFYGNIRHSTIFSYFWSFHFLNLLNIGGVSHSINKTNANFFFSWLMQMARATMARNCLRSWMFLGFHRYVRFSFKKVLIIKF